MGLRGLADEDLALLHAIASTNTASLALHASRGFLERGRRTVYELTLT